MRPRFPFPLNAAIIACGALLVGKSAATSVVAPATTTVVQHGTDTEYLTHTRTVRRVVRGKIVTVQEQSFVLVPVVIVHADHHKIRVPKHLLPLRSAAATIANPKVTVTVAIPGPSAAPVTVTTTVTSVSTETLPPVTVTTTISLPLIPTTSDQ